jgi:gliding motility-associated-like protein
MKKYFFLFIALSFSFTSCDEQEEQQTCSCSSDPIDKYHYISASDTENIAIPTAFTPNGDGRNDKFYVYGYHINSLNVIVRDGNTVVFQTLNQNTGWDGAINGSVPACQTFDYDITATLASGTIKHFEGTVTLFNSSSCPDNFLNCVFGYNYDGASFNPGMWHGENFPGCD